MIQHEDKGVPAREALLQLLILIYPTWYSWNQIKWHGATRFGVVPNDVGLSIRTFQALERMSLPWSVDNFSKFPLTSGFWRLELITDSVVELGSWVVLHLIEPTYLANLIVWFGSVLAGIFSFRLFRVLRIKLPIALLGATLIQALPGTRQMMLTGIVSVYAVPLFLLFTLISVNIVVGAHALGRRELMPLTSFLLFTFLFSYNFFVIFLLLSTMLLGFEYKKIWKIIQTFRDSNRRPFLALKLVGVGVSFIGALWLARWLLARTRSEFGSPYGLYPNSEVLKDPFPLKGFVTPDPFHLLFPTGVWESEGYSQQYGGIVIVFGALASMFFLLKRVPRTFILIAYLTGILLLISLGPIQILNLEIPSVRQLLKYLIPGMRRYSVAGLMAQVGMTLLFCLLVQRVWNRFGISSFRKFILLLVLVVSLIDLNPASRRFAYATERLLSPISAALKELPESGLYVPQGIVNVKDNYIFNKPIFSNHADLFGALAYSDSCFANFLVAHQVDYLLAEIDRQGNPFFLAQIPDSIRMTLPLNPEMFTNVSDKILIRTDKEDQKMLQLLRFSGDTDSGASSCPILAQYVAEPALGIPDSSIDRRLVSANWVTSNRSTLSTEILPDDSGLIESSGDEILFKARFVLPPNVKSPQEVVLTSSIEVQTAIVGEGGTDIQISARLGERIDVRTVGPCLPATSSTLGELDGREICFGITSFSVLQFGKPD